jgi:hypothetical protein
MNTGRANPFTDLSDFEPKPASSSTAAVRPAAIEQVAEDNGFPSRQPKNSATAAVIERLYRSADTRHLPLGQVLEMALEALERQGGEGPYHQPSTSSGTVHGTCRRQGNGRRLIAEKSHSLRDHAQFVGQIGFQKLTRGWTAEIGQSRGGENRVVPTRTKL